MNLSNHDMNPILFLHGALGTEKQLHPLISELHGAENVYTLTFEGHGTEEVPERPFRIENFAENVIRYMDEHSIETANIFGYSMGGYVALYLAKAAPNRVGKIATLGTVLTWSPEKAASETKLLNPNNIEEKVPAFAKMLDGQHPKGWKDMVLKTKDLLGHLGDQPTLSTEDFREIDHPVRIHIGDRDSTADLNETVKVYGLMKHAELSVMPATPHPIQKVNLSKLAGSLDDFFELM